MSDFIIMVRFVLAVGSGILSLLSFIIALNEPVIIADSFLLLTIVTAVAAYILYPKRDKS